MLTSRYSAREIPASVRGKLLFGGFSNQFGWLFFGFGLIFTWVFAANIDLSFIHFHGKIITAEGVITATKPTNSSENGQPIFEHHYVFPSALGGETSGVSYTFDKDAYNTGAAVTIEYPHNKPRFSRIRNSRTGIFSPIALIVLIFPLTGLVFLFFGLRRGMRAIRLLKHGVLTSGRLTAKEATNTTINESRVYKLSFTFKDSLGESFEVEEKTHRPYHLEDDREEHLLYLRERPEYAVMLDSLSEKPLLDEMGIIPPLPVGRVLPVLIFPLLTIAGHGCYIASHYFTV